MKERNHGHFNLQISKFFQLAIEIVNNCYRNVQTWATWDEDAVQKHKR